MMIISLIAAVSENGVIGNKNKLPWHIPEELKYFRKMTLGKPVIMGRKTFESMGLKPLPNRQNIILTHQKQLSFKEVTLVHSIEEALCLCKNTEEIMIIGGDRVYQQFLPMASRLYLTMIHGYFKGDTFFPPVDWDQWEMISENKGLEFTTKIWKRK